MGSGRSPRSWKSCADSITAWPATRCEISSLDSLPNDWWSLAMNRPYGMLAELTYACPLHCPYCSNPLNLTDYREELTTAEWQRVMTEARALGVLQLHLSGGEPLQRRDLVELVASARDLGLYTNLITNALGLSPRRANQLKTAGLDHVQISIQADEQALSDRIAGTPSYGRKIAAARLVKELAWPLTLNVVLYRHNIDRIGRILDLAEEVVRAARQRLEGKMQIIYVIPDYYSQYPKPCMGGWGQKQLTVTPNGGVLPCPAAHTLNLPRATVREHSLAWIWEESPLFQRFRGTEWMPEPCRSCDRREVDFGGCRCQAFQLTGDAARTDPVCHLSPDHWIVAEAVQAANEGAEQGEADLIPRTYTVRRV